MLGVVDFNTALTKAESVGLDLVEIVPNSTPPVCKILDFGKYKYESKKKLQNAKKKQKVVAIKEIKLRPNIGTHDLEVKLKHIRKFISHGEKVKITLRFKGREISHRELGMDLVNKVVDEISDIAQAEIEPKIEGRQIIAMLIAKVTI
jgi:translation initiation factor IF-3